MKQASLFPEPAVDADLDLPPLVAGPYKFAIGHVNQRLREAVTTVIETSYQVSISARTEETAYELANGDVVIITHRRNLKRPDGVSGVLRRTENGGLVWDSHELLVKFDADREQIGLKGLAAGNVAQWEHSLAFKAERQNEAGAVALGGEGLRPPQLGALHAIGAHWSVFTSAATIVMPTGTGKTETMLAALAAYVRDPLLVVVPGDQLRSQIADKFARFGILRQLTVLKTDVPNPLVATIKRRPQTEDDLDIFENCNVAISTMSSATGGNATPLAPSIAERVGVLFVDEAHHIPASTWTSFKEAFGQRRILQFTATPFRRDTKLVDGQVIYNYPLRQAQEDGYFKPISFEPVHEIDDELSDQAIAESAIQALRDDIAAGQDHLLMARCSKIDRATEVYKIYAILAPEFRPLLVHSEIGDTEAMLEALRNRESRIIVCVNMLGEGFDLPQLKVAALHDLHKSLAILLQFAGRFTRSAGSNIGDATVVANTANVHVTDALERLYSEDADWNQLLSELSSKAAREHAELVAFLEESIQLGEIDEEEAISHHLLRPTLSTLTYRASEFRPERFHEGLPRSANVRAAWRNPRTNTLFFVTRSEPAIKWMRSKALRDRQYALFVLHYDASRDLIYLSSTDRSSNFERMAAAVGGDVKLISGDQIFRSLGNVSRLVFQNVGVKKHGRRNLRYAMYTGADVAEALTISERAGSVKSNVSGTGWADGQHIMIGCSYKGRVWSREQGSVPRFVEWSEQIGSKLTDDTISTSDIIANVLIPTEVEGLPDKQILGVDWPIELLRQADERVVFSRGTQEEPLSMFSLLHSASSIHQNTIDLILVHADDAVWARYRLHVGGENGFRVTSVEGETVEVHSGRIQTPFEGYLTDYPPLVRFVDLTELDGNLLIAPQNVDAVPLPKERFEPWDWSDIDITKESIWKKGEERHDSIQWRAGNTFVEAGFDVVFDDDAAGEAADLVCLKEEEDHIRLVLAHCKFSHDLQAGARVSDVVEVSSQAVRSAKWKWKFKDLCRHLAAREKRLAKPGRSTRFMTGNPGMLNRFAKTSRFKSIKPEILIIQPGISESSISTDQSIILGAAMTYLKETIGVDLDVICSA